jgi:hypothetical protein
MGSCRSDILVTVMMNVLKITPPLNNSLNGTDFSSEAEIRSDSRNSLPLSMKPATGVYIGSYSAQNLTSSSYTNLSIFRCSGRSKKIS